VGGSAVLCMREGGKVSVDFLSNRLEVRIFRGSGGVMLIVGQRSGGVMPTVKSEYSDRVRACSESGELVLPRTTADGGVTSCERMWFGT